MLSGEIGIAAKKPGAGMPEYLKCLTFVPVLAYARRLSKNHDHVGTTRSQSPRQVDDGVWLIGDTQSAHHCDPIGHLIADLDDENLVAVARMAYDRKTLIVIDADSRQG